MEQKHEDLVLNKKLFDALEAASRTQTRVARLIGYILVLVRSGEEGKEHLSALANMAQGMARSVLKGETS